MPTPAERQALLFVAAVAALGVAVRGGRMLGSRADRAEGAALAAQIAAVDSAVTQGGRARRPRAASRQLKATPDEGRPAPAAQAATPPPPTGPIDVDRATAAELDRLPGIGPALAARIIADREARGPFGGLDALQDVRGIGPALAAKLATLVTFSGPPRANRLHP